MNISSLRKPPRSSCHIIGSHDLYDLALACSVGIPDAAQVLKLREANRGERERAPGSDKSRHDLG